MNKTKINLDQEQQIRMYVLTEVFQNILNASTSTNKEVEYRCQIVSEIAADYLKLVYEPISLNIKNIDNKPYIPIKIQTDGTDSHDNYLSEYGCISDLDKDNNQILNIPYDIQAYIDLTDKGDEELCERYLYLMKVLYKCECYPSTLEEKIDSLKLLKISDKEILRRQKAFDFVYEPRVKYLMDKRSDIKLPKQKLLAIITTLEHNYSLKK